MHENFRIGIRSETMPKRLQFTPQLLEIVGFAVVDDHNRAVFVFDRLFSSGQVDNGKPAHGHGEVPRHAVLNKLAIEKAVLVWTTMAKRLIHRPNKRRIPSFVCSPGEISTNSAHV